jgi:hypothetical protein
MDDTNAHCDALDTQFAGSFCEHQRQCAFLDSCHNHEVEIYDALVANSASAMQARQDQFSSLDQVECLLSFITQSINGNETIQESDLNTCDGDVEAAHLQLETPTPVAVPACPDAEDDDPVCEPVVLPPIWSNGEAGAGQAQQISEFDMNGVTPMPDGAWQLAMNLDTNDGNPLPYSNANFWESATALGGATDDASLSLSQDFKDPAVFTAGPVQQVLIAVHEEGVVKGWRRWRATGHHSSLHDYFTAANRCGQHFQGGQQVRLSSEMIDGDAGTLDMHEPMVANQKAPANDLWVNANTQDHDRLTTSSQPPNNLGYGLGTAYDLGGGDPCRNTYRPQADAQLFSDVHHWGSGGGIGGLIGNDHRCNDQDNSCPDGRCGGCPWTVPSGLQYDYAIFVTVGDS